MSANRTFALVCLSAVVAFGACDGDGFITEPGAPNAGGASRDLDCRDDATAPEIQSVSVSPRSLWPPDHRMVPITVHAEATDACGPLSISIVDVTSDEPLNGLGDGDTSPDWRVESPLGLALRSERAGTGDGRVYTIRVRFADGIGNERFESVQVVVPHDNWNP